MDDLIMVICYRIIVLALIFRCYNNIIECYRFEPNTFSLTNFTGCPNDEDNMVHFKPNVTQNARNKYVVNGEITIKETLFGPFKVSNAMKGAKNSIPKFFLIFQLQVTSKRCDFQMTRCETYDIFTIRDLCKVIELSDQFWTDFMVHTHPKAKCPFNMKTIKVTNATVDLGYLSYLPLEGYNWTFFFKAFQSIAKTKDKYRLIYCGISEVNITKAHGGKKRNQNPTHKLN